MSINDLSDKMPVRYNLSSVWVRLSIFSQLSIVQYVGLCVFSLPISFVMIERIYIICLIIIIKSEVWTITHYYYPCLGLGHETMVCAVCISILLSVPILLLPIIRPVAGPSSPTSRQVWRILLKSVPTEDLDGRCGVSLINATCYPWCFTCVKWDVS